MIFGSVVGSEYLKKYAYEYSNQLLGERYTPGVKRSQTIGQTINSYSSCI